MRRVLPYLLIVIVVVFAVFLGGCAGKAATSTTTSSGESTSTTIGEGLGGDTSTSLSLDTSTTLETTSTTVATTPAAASQGIRHQQTETRLAYSGTWSTTAAGSASGGSFVYANASGSVTVRFIGTHVSWIAKTSPSYGKAKVTVDGSSAGAVDLYSASTKWQQKVWQSGTLKSGSHVVTIAWTGSKRTAAKGTYIDVDALDVVGVVTGRYQQSNARLVYAGSWKTTATSSAAGGSFAYANTSGSSVTIHFSGIDLAWYAKQGPTYGKAKVTVDGGSPVTVDLYSAGVLWKQRVWSTGILASGTHTVKIQWAGSKRTAATGTNINIDQVDVTGTLK